MPDKLTPVSDFENFLNDLYFEFVQPDSVPDVDGWFRVTRSNGTRVRLLVTSDHPFDLINTRIRHGEYVVKARLRELTALPRMSTFAVSSIIQTAVASLKGDDAFVNVGLWHGYTFLSGVLGNADKTCIGIDDFSNFDKPRADFAARFEKLKGPKHRFFEMDYRRYLQEEHSGPIGFYVYDGDHSYKNQLLGLRLAEPHFAEDCIVLVDDTNWSEPRRALIDFVKASKNGYRLLLDRTTLPYSGRLTYWNGVTVLQRCPERKPLDYPEAPCRAAWGGTNDIALVEEPPEDPLVTVVLLHTGSASVLRTAIDTCVSQTDVKIELLVIDRIRDSASRATLHAMQGQVSEVHGGPADKQGDLQGAVNVSRGDYICFLETSGVIKTDLVAKALDSGGRLASWVSREMQVARQLARHVPAGEKLILVDEQQFNRHVAEGREAVPFLERNGRYWGNPSNSAEAITELERLRNAGARYIAFGWPTFWWQNYYGDFMSYLDTHYQCQVLDEQLLVFDIGEEVTVG